MAVQKKISDARASRSDEDFVPVDAGAFYGEFVDLISRMDTGYWPTINVPTGWYATVAALNEQIRNIDPSYTVHRVADRFGVLQFHYSLKTQDESKKRQAAAAVEKARELVWELCRVCGVVSDTTYCTTHKKGRKK